VVVKEMGRANNGNDDEIHPTRNRPKPRTEKGITYF
jgi:hypothetical protein